MLSDVKTIKNAKELCRFVTKRTGTEPISRCNKVLARYRPEADYQVQFRMKVQGAGVGAIRILSITGKQISTGRQLRQQSLTLPVSQAQLMQSLTEVDGYCERELRLAYGQEAVGVGASRPR